MVAVFVTGLASACVTAPVAAPPVVAPTVAPSAVPLDRRVAWILRLEDERILRDLPAAAPPSSPPAGTAPAGSTSFSPATEPDLIKLVRDVDPAVRRRAALAIGRVGVTEGAPALIAALSDPDTDVRASAAFGLGLLGSKSAVTPLVSALKDPAPAVDGRAAEALGLIGDASAAPAIAAMGANCHAALAGIAPDDEQMPKGAEVEACRLAMFALVRLKSYDALASVVLDAAGQPVSRWWPIAFSLQRINDKRAIPALVWLASSTGVNTPAFAFRGLGALHDAQAAPVARAVMARREADVRVRIAAARMLGQVGDAPAVDALLAVLADRTAPLNLSVEVVTALGATASPKVFDVLVDELSHPSPVMRVAAMAAAAKVDADGFLLLASSLGVDSDWTVRAASGAIFASLPAERVRPVIDALVADTDLRVRSAGLEALAKIGAPDLNAKLYDALQSQDFALRATAATLIGSAKPADGVAHLIAAYARAKEDTAADARIAALEALSLYGGDEAKWALQEALADPAWPVRLRAAAALRAKFADATAEPVRPAPLRRPAAFFGSPQLLHPTYSPHAFIETRYGTIEIELDVVDAPLTVMNFVDLARANFFSGMKIHRVVPDFVVQAGDQRGDGVGGPGYAIRDELSTLPFVRGSVGMALDGADTGGSQFFITVSPQPHLDAKYTVFGRVVKGLEILDQITQWDVIDRIRIWDGVSFLP